MKRHIADDPVALRHLALLATGATLISFAPVFVKLVVQRGVEPTPIGFWRLFLGSMMLFALSIALGAKPAISRRRAVYAILGGLFFAADLFMWHKSIIFIGAGMATLLANTQVFWTAGLGRILYGESLSMLYLIAVPLAMVGMTMLTGVGSNIVFDGAYRTGIALGLATGMAYALYLISLKQTSKNRDLTSLDLNLGMSRRERITDAIALLAWVSLFSAVFSALMAAVEGVSLAVGWPELGLLAALALVAQVAGWILIYVGLGHVSTGRAALVILLQPTLAMVWGWMFFDETLIVTQLIGAAITLSAIYLGGVRRAPTLQQAAE